MRSEWTQGAVGRDLSSLKALWPAVPTGASDRLPPHRRRRAGKSHFRRRVTSYAIMIDHSKSLSS